MNKNLTPTLSFLLFLGFAGSALFGLMLVELWWGVARRGINPWQIPTRDGNYIIMAVIWFASFGALGLAHVGRHGEEE